VTKKTFRTRVIAIGPGGAWRRVMIPVVVQKTFGAKGRVSVKATVGGRPFHTSIFPTGDGTHYMMFNKAMQAAAGVAPGDSVSISLEPDKGEEADVPAPLKAALKAQAGAQAKFKTLTPAGQREFIAWILSAKQDATRVTRAAKAAQMVMAGKKRLD